LLVLTLPSKSLQGINWVWNTLPHTLDGSTGATSTTNRSFFRVCPPQKYKKDYFQLSQNLIILLNFIPMI